MPAIDYTSIAANALSAIQDAGAAVVVTRTTEGALDPATGTTAAATVTTATGYGVQTQYNARDIDGTIIKRGDMRLLIASSGLTIEPDVGDTATIDSVVWNVVNVESVSPAGTPVLFICQVRR